MTFPSAIRFSGGYHFLRRANVDRLNIAALKEYLCSMSTAPAGNTVVSRLFIDSDAELMKPAHGCSHMHDTLQENIFATKQSKLVLQSNNGEVPVVHGCSQEQRRASRRFKVSAALTAAVSKSCTSFSDSALMARAPIVSRIESLIPCPRRHPGALALYTSDFRATQTRR